MRRTCNTVLQKVEIDHEWILHFAPAAFEKLCTRPPTSRMPCARTQSHADRQSAFIILLAGFTGALATTTQPAVDTFLVCGD